MIDKKAAPAEAPASKQRAAIRDDDTTSKAAKTASEARLWASEHEDAWNYMCRLCERETAAKRRCSMQWAIERARKVDFASFKDGRVLVNNSYAPAFSRMFVKRHPAARKYFDIRRSMLDRLL